MNAYPFSLFKRVDRNCYSVAFKGEDGKYLPPVSTGKKDEKEAMQAAFQMLRDGIPKSKNKKQKTVTVQDLTLKDTVRKIKTPEEAQVILDELRRLGWIKSYVMKGTPGAEDFIAFLTRFWDWEESPYIREKLRKEHGIHRRYCKGQKSNVAMYWTPFFKGRLLGEITAKDVDDFIDHIGQMPFSASWKNLLIYTGSIPLSWAFSKGMIDGNPANGHMKFSATLAKRHILTLAKAAAVFNAPWPNEREMLGNLLASVTGMRLGEIQALRMRDIERDRIQVCASWNPVDKRKPTKNNEPRTVEVNFPELMAALLKLARSNPWGATPDSLVFWADHSPDVPVSGKRLLYAKRDALVYTGMTEEEAEKYVFHGWRHFYTSYMVKGLDKKLLKSQTGHRTDDMLEHYADHELDGDRETIRAVQRRTFAGLLPMNVFTPNEKIAETA